MTVTRLVFVSVLCLLLFSTATTASTASDDDETARAKAVLEWLMDGPLDASCTATREKFFYRQLDGGCNWLRPNDTQWGQVGTPLARDHFQNSYKDGISEPRDGPNAREVSNAFFRRHQRLYYKHTPILVGLVEFVIHDISTTGRSRNETIVIPVPKCDQYFDPACEGTKTLTLWRTLAVPGTGTSRENPRENVNTGSAWLDLSPIYGSSKEVSDRLRLWSEDPRQRGKMLTQKGPDGGDYAPFDTMGVPVNGWRREKLSQLFATGDPRQNQDWLIMAAHTLLLRNHNRFCDLLLAENPGWEEEKVFQYARHLNIAHYSVTLNLYQQAYYTSEISPPASDGFGLFREWYGQTVLTINPYHNYPWSRTLVQGRPLVTSQELAMGYRFHDLIPEEFPLINDKNVTTEMKRVNNTSFDAEGFFKVGVDAVLRGMAGSTIPNFKSGISEDYRNARISYSLPGEGHGFDLAAWTIVQERERGIPPFNEYFRKYPGHVAVAIREKFEDFTSNPEFVAELKRLYKTPDEVDFSVGLVLDEQYYPGTTVPRTQLITSLFSLFGVGTSDRFSVAYSVVSCMLAGKPWDCTPLNPVDDMLWKPVPLPFFPRARWFSNWFAEIDMADNGDYSLWHLITKNSNVKCLQLNPFFPANPQTNPVSCTIPPSKSSVPQIVVSVLAGAFLVYLIVKSCKSKQ